ncbi:Na(+)/H(+) exchange regulatory cofactor NHE-RF1, variant 2 [Balamuthia mandrillaris]
MQQNKGKQQQQQQGKKGGGPAGGRGGAGGSKPAANGANPEPQPKKQNPNQRGGGQQARKEKVSVEGGSPSSSTEAPSTAATKANGPITYEALFPRGNPYAHKQQHHAASSQTERRGRREASGKEGTSSSSSSAHHHHHQQQPAGQEQLPPEFDDSAQTKKLDEIEAKLGHCFAELENIRKQVENLQDEKRGIKEKQDQTLELKKEHQQKKKEAQAERKALYDKRDKLIEARKKLPYTLRGQGKTQNDLIEYNNEKIDIEVQRLEKLVQASKSTVQDRELTNKIKTWEAKRKLVREYTQLLHDLKLDLSEPLEDGAKNQQLHAEIGRFIDLEKQQSKEMDELNQAFRAKQSAVTPLYNRRDQIKKLINLLKEEKKQVLQERNRIRNEWRKHQRALKHAEWEKREKERQERLAKRKEVEEAKRQKELQRVPFKEEIARCGRILVHLEKLLQDPSQKKKKEKKEEEPTQKEEEKEEEEKTEEEEQQEEEGKGKEKEEENQDKELTHSMKTYLEFEKLSLAPPTRKSEVQASIQQVQARKVWSISSPLVSLSASLLLLLCFSSLSSKDTLLLKNIRNIMKSYRLNLWRKRWPENESVWPSWKPPKLPPTRSRPVKTSVKANKTLLLPVMLPTRKERMRRRKMKRRRN